MKSLLRLPIAAILLPLSMCFLAIQAGGNPADPSTSQPEAERVQLVRGLLKQRVELLSTRNVEKLQACDLQLKRHPAPADGEAGVSVKLLAGKWRSSRHDYLYRPDGTWTMLPAEKGILHGHWRITGNQVERTSGYEAPESTDHYTLILLTEKDYVYTDGESVFCETRPGK